MSLIWEHHAHSQSVIMCDTIHWCTHTHSYQHVCTRTCLIRTLDRVTSLFLSSPWNKDTLPKVSILERFYCTHTHSHPCTHAQTHQWSHTHTTHTEHCWRIQQPWPRGAGMFSFFNLTQWQLIPKMFQTQTSIIVRLTHPFSRLRSGTMTTSFCSRQ